MLILHKKNHFDRFSGLVCSDIKMSLELEYKSSWSTQLRLCNKDITIKSSIVVYIIGMKEGTKEGVAMARLTWTYKRVFTQAWIW